jgi:hypothetical protein
VQAHFGEKAIFGEKSTKWEKDSWKESNMCEGSMQGDSMQGKPNYIRVRVFARDCNG